MPVPAETAREFGEELRRDRELRDVSREQLAVVTKVSLRQIEALETGRFEHLPALVFSRGFVRAIALHLGLDPERAVAAFSHVYQTWSEEAAASKPVSGVMPRLSRPRRSVSSDTTVLGIGVAALLALVTGLAAFLKTRGPETNAPVPAPTAPTRAESGPASLALPPAVASNTVALPPEVAVPSRAPVSFGAQPMKTGERRLTLTFRDDCWTEVRVDGKVVVAETFHKGETREFTAVHRFTLTLGNAGGVEVAVDGRSLQSIGTSGQVVKNYVIEEGTPRPSING